MRKLAIKRVSFKNAPNNRTLYWEHNDAKLNVFSFKIKRGSVIAGSTFICKPKFVRQDRWVYMRTYTTK